VRTLALGILAFALVALSAGSAHADPPPAADDYRARPRVNPADDGNVVKARPDRARPVVGEPAVEAEDWALALPRLVLAAPRVVLDTAFLPVKGLLYLVGRYQIPERVIDVLYNDERNAAIIPTFSFLGGQGGSVGVTAFHGGWGRHGERLGFSAKFGGRYVQSYRLELSAPSVAGTPFGIEVETRFEVEPHLRFYGYGAGADEQTAPTPAGPRDVAVPTVYHQQRGLVRVRPGWSFNDEISAGITGVFNTREFGGRVRDSDTDPSIEEVYDTSQLPGFDRGYVLAEAVADLRVDARFPKGATSQGVYFHALGGGAPPQRGFQFGHYAFELAGFIDLYHQDRVLVLRAAHEAVVGDEAEIPFSDMPRLGGPQRLRGYDLDRFRDKDVALATIEYHYPIHEYLGGFFFFEVGSVGPDYPTMFKPENYRLSGGGGIQLRSRDTKLLTLQLGYGDGLHVFLTTDPLPIFEKRTEAL